MAKYIKTSKTDFERFKKAFLKYVKLFGLTGYRVTFHHIPLDDDYARLQTNEESKSAEVQLTSRFDSAAKKAYSGPKGEAKHEALHLLINRLVWLGRCRFVKPDDFYEEEEKLVRTLEKVID